MIDNFCVLSFDYKDATLLPQCKKDAGLMLLRLLLKHLLYLKNTGVNDVANHQEYQNNLAHEEQADTQSTLCKKIIRKEGLGEGILVKTPSGYCAIENLKNGELVVTYDHKNHVQTYNKVSNICKIQIDKFIRLFIQDYSINIAPDHKIYLYAIEQWVTAQQLKNSSVLRRFFNQQVAVENIEEVYQQANFYKLSVETNHNFYIQHDILLHNYMPAIVVPIAAQILIHIEQLEDFFHYACNLAYANMLIFNKTTGHHKNHEDFQAPIQKAEEAPSELVTIKEQPIETNNLQAIASNRYSNTQNKSIEPSINPTASTAIPLSTPATSNKLMKHAREQELSSIQVRAQHEQPVVTITPTSYEITQDNFHAHIEQVPAKHISSVKHQVLDTIHNEEEHRWQLHHNAIYCQQYSQQHEQISNCLIGAVHNKSITNQIKNRLAICWLEQPFNPALTQTKLAFFEQFFDLSGKLKTVAVNQQAIISLLQYYPSQMRTVIANNFRNTGMPSIDNAYTALQRKENWLINLGSRIDNAAHCVKDGIIGFGKFFFGLDDTIEYNGTLANRIAYHPVNQTLHNIIKLCETGDLKQAEILANRLNEVNAFAIINEFKAIAKQKDRLSKIKAEKSSVIEYEKVLNTNQFFSNNPKEPEKQKERRSNLESPQKHPSSITSVENITIFRATNKTEAREILKKIENLSSEIKKTIKNTIDSTSHSYTDYCLEKINNNYLFTFTKPGNVPGSKAIYYKLISEIGKTKEIFKDTFDHLGKFVHRKIK